MNRYNTDTPFVAIATYYCGGPVVDALIKCYEASGRPAFNIFKLSELLVNRQLIIASPVLFVKETLFKNNGITAFS